MDTLKNNQTYWQRLSLKQGDPVMCNGYPGAILRQYDGSMYEVRLSRGTVCVDAIDIFPYCPINAH